MRKQILAILSQLQPSEAIALVESIGKELRQKNSIRINEGGIKNVIDAERFDLVQLKSNENKNS
mgnify:CR=1 FL=1|jgi:hypothetical protein